MIEWRSVNDLPDELPEDDEWEITCVVTWQHADYPQDKGADVASLRQIREGDFLVGEYKDAVWRALMDSPTFKEP